MQALKVLRSLLVVALAEQKLLAVRWLKRAWRPASHIQSNVDYYIAEAHTTYGVIGGRFGSTKVKFTLRRNHNYVANTKAMKFRKAFKGRNRGIVANPRVCFGSFGLMSIGRSRPNANKLRPQDARTTRCVKRVVNPGFVFFQTSQSRSHLSSSG